MSLYCPLRKSNKIIIRKTQSTLVAIRPKSQYSIFSRNGLHPKYSTARSEEDFQWFELECRYRNYDRSIKQHISDFGEDDFEHTEKLPKQKLTLTTSNSFNLNISSETIHVFNHWQSSFAESFTELEKTSSLTNQSAPSPQHSIISNTKSLDHEVKAPITIFNMTDHDIVLKASSNWKDFDPSTGRTGGVSPKTSNLLFIVLKYMFEKKTPSPLLYWF